MPPSHRDSSSTPGLRKRRTVQELEETSEKLHLICDFPGCRSERTFKRSYELQSHMKEHAQIKEYDCPAVNCKYRGRKTFYRWIRLSLM